MHASPITRGHSHHDRPGDNTTCAGTPGTCVAGTVTIKVADDGVTPGPAATLGVGAYGFVKGNFRWQRNIRPAYRWSNGKSTHALTSDRFAIAARGTTTHDGNRISLGEPVGSRADGKIMPFKLMRGRQAFFVDGASSFTINPNVFGTGSLWGVLQAVGYSFATYDFDGAGPVAPGAPSVEALWGKILGVGARAANISDAHFESITQYKCQPKAPTKSGGKLSESDDVHCEYHSQFSTPVGTIKSHCSRMTTELDLKFIKLGLKQDMNKETFNDQFMSCSVKMGVSAGAGIKNGPLKAEASIGAAVGAEFDRSGLKDIVVKVNAGVSAGSDVIDGGSMAGVGISDLSADAGVQGQVSLISEK